MTNTAQLAKTQLARFPEVIALVVGDTSGALIEAKGEFDAEAVAAIIAVVTRALGNAGDPLGIGTFHRATLTGPGMACLLMPHEREILGIYMDPSKSVSGLEKKLDTLVGR